MLKMNRPEIRIEFDNETAAYESQDFIHGHVTIICNKAIQLKEIKVRCKGHGEVNLVQQEAQRFHKEETYVDETTILLANITPGGIFLSPGHSVFRFQFQLPANVPSSYECHSCAVRYSCIAYITPVISTNSSSLTYVYEKMFLVNGCYNIQQIQNVDEPVLFMGEKNLTWLFGCFSMGKICTTFSVNKRAYSIGDRIHIAVNIVNKTSEYVNVFTASLIKITSFKDAAGKKRSDRLPQTVSTIQNECAQRPRSIGWARTTLKIPENVPPTNLGSGCKLFKVQYFLKLLISCSVKESSSSLRIYLPITIGYPGRAHRESNFDLEDLPPYVSIDPPPYDEVARNDLTITTLPTYDEISAPPPYGSHGFTC